MNNGIKIIFSFALGAAAGTVVAWKLLDKKYALLAQEEIDSVKEMYARREEKSEDVEETTEDVTDEITEEDVERYNEIAAEYAETEKKGGSKSMKKKSLIEVIAPEDFGENDYKTVSLTYYTDHVLTDENNKVIKDIDAVVGIESLSRFGEYEDDSVFVRNHTAKTDYEILMDYREYSQVMNPTDGD